MFIGLGLAVTGQRPAAFYPDAVVALDFANNAYRVGLNAPITADPDAITGLTYTRADAQSAYVEDVSGLLIPKATGKMRVSNKGLLVEEARTNTIIQSQFANGFTNWNMAGTPTGGSLTTGAGIAPDGTNTFALFTAGTATFNNILRQGLQTYTAGATYTFTLFVKPSGGTARYVGFRMSNWSEGVVSDLYPFIDLQTLTTNSNGHAGITWIVEPKANGVYRVGFSVTTNTTVNSVTDIAVTQANGNTNTAALAGQTLMMWGAQVEAGTFPTSYIPTTGVSATRALDSGMETLSAVTDGTLFAEFLLTQVATSPVPVGHSSLDTAGINMSGTAGNHWNGTAQIGATGVTVLGAITKTALGFTPGQRKFAVNNSAVTTSATTVGTFDRLHLGRALGGGQVLNSYLRRVLLYPAMMTDAQLQALTA